MTEPRFVIDGQEYPVPNLSNLTMGEALIVEDYSGLGLDELVDGGLKPSVIAALMHVAYTRENPDVPKRQVRELVEASNLMDAVARLEAEEEEQQNPPDSTQKNGDDTSDENGNGDASKPSSGDGSGLGSERLAAVLKATGTPASATSAT